MRFLIDGYNLMHAAGFLATREALGHLERSMYALYREKANYPPNLYAAMAEPTVDEILKLRAEIDEYIGLTEFATSSQPRNPIPAVPALAENEGPSVPGDQQSAAATTTANGQP